MKKSNSKSKMAIKYLKNIYPHSNQGNAYENQKDISIYQITGK